MLTSSGGLPPFSDFDAWFVRRILAGKPDPLEGAPISSWLAPFLQRVDIHHKAGQELLFAVIGSDGWEKIKQQDPNTSEPRFTSSQASDSKWHLYHASELDQLPSVTWLIEPEIPSKTLIVLFGASGVGKSFKSLDYAIRIAQSIPVVYVAAEGESGYRDRTRAWIQHFRQKPGALYFVFGAVKMLDRAIVDSFIEAMRPIAPGLIILDTLALCMVGGDENSARDMGLFIEACERIKQQLGTAVLVVHHTGKNGTSERGSSALRGAADSMIELSSDEGFITVSCSKAKDWEPFPKQYLRLLPVQLEADRSSCVLIPMEKVIELKGQPLSENEKLLMTTLKLETFLLPGARVTQLVNVTGISERSIHRIVSKLIRFGYVEQAKRGEPYKLTEEGFNLNLN